MIGRVGCFDDSCGTARAAEEGSIVAEDSSAGAGARVGGDPRSTVDVEGCAVDDSAGGDAAAARIAVEDSIVAEDNSTGAGVGGEPRSIVDDEGCAVEDSAGGDAATEGRGCGIVDGCGTAHATVEVEAGSTGAFAGGGCEPRFIVNCKGYEPRRLRGCSVMWNC